jgi:ornithine cyclodeaminase
MPSEESALNQSPSSFSIIDARTVSDILSENRPLVYEMVKDAYRAFGKRQAINPHSTFLAFSELNKDSINRIIALPAYLGGSVDAAGIKWVASFPDNANRGLARASALLILNDMTTGYPYACIEGSLISASRTAASAVLGAEIICNGFRTIKNLGVIGTGFIAQTILDYFLSLQWDIKNIHLHDTVLSNGQRFKNRLTGKFLGSISVAEDVSDVLQNSDLLIFATTAPRPYIHQLPKPTKVLNISLRDLSPQIVLQSNNIVDDIDHCLRANTSVHLAEQEIGSRDFSVLNIYDCIDKGMPESWSRNQDQSTIFSPFGLGVLDIAVGTYIYGEASRQRRVAEISGFYS